VFSNANTNRAESDEFALVGVIYLFHVVFLHTELHLVKTANFSEKYKN